MFDNYYLSSVTYITHTHTHISIVPCWLDDCTLNDTKLCCPLPTPVIVIVLIASRKLLEVVVIFFQNFVGYF